MTIVWKDCFGTMEMEVDAHECAIHFMDKYAQFIGRDWNEYLVPVEDIIEIRMD